MTMEQIPLYAALKRHLAQNRSAFHTPGHSGHLPPFLQNLLQFDTTELPDTDSLYEAQGSILQAERRAARVFGAGRTLFSAGGCTLCIQTMLRLVCSGKKIIAHRVLHRSAVNAMALLDIQPVWLLPGENAGRGFSGRIVPQDVERLLRQHGDIAAVYLTSPDYFGVISDIAGIARICHGHGVPLLVDNAHGAHLFLTPENLHPLALGADITACSAHKTLPVFTGGAFLNFASDTYAQQAKQAMALFGSTSPSYPIMASLDLCMQWAQMQGKQAYAHLVRRVDRLKDFARRHGILLPQGLTDPTRLTLQTAALGVSGVQAAEIFRAYFVEPEYADEVNLVLITTPFHTERDFLRVERAIAALPKKTPFCIDTVLPPLPKVELSVRQAVFAPAEKIPLQDSVGRIAADTACPCPPGVPVVMPGEVITKEIVGFLKKYRFLTVKVVK